MCIDVKQLFKIDELWFVFWKITGWQKTIQKMSFNLVDLVLTEFCEQCF